MPPSAPWSWASRAPAPPPPPWLAWACASKKPKKEVPSDSGNCSSSDAESELPKEDESKYPEDLEEKMKVFNNPKIQGKKNSLEKMGGEVVDIMKKSGSDAGQQLAGMKFIAKVLMEEGASGEEHPENGTPAQTIRDKILKMLVEMLSGQPKEEHPSCTQVQKIALAALKVITGASKHDIRSMSRCLSRCLPLSESGTQMMLEIFASIGSATPEGSKGLLGAIPAAIELMLNTPGHKSLAEQLVACDISAVLKKCLSAPRAETMLAHHRPQPHLHGAQAGEERV
ncbi:hypothetical protein SKAU_G00160930 [Synaphobranchus kaupii]|uniref:Uncharacterized protein n=1 Tax=Synaphobranchus kaupii TaxID=118154 RepID=A0A9Q1IZE6_SYNKA|nr:hypothetical protein SKAU_G00160930 [Synaphobranchus kaupii]